MRNKIKEAIQVYNSTPLKLNPAVFILGIFLLIRFATGIQMKENAVLYSSYAIGSIVVGTIIDYLILMRRNQEYYAAFGRKQAVQVAYALFSILLITLAAILAFVLTHGF